MTDSDRFSSSLRDPYGFLTLDDAGNLLRHVDPKLAIASREFLASDYYEKLVSSRNFVEHRDVSSEHALVDGAMVLEPRKVPVVTYPYEWPFHLLKKAALLTLDIQIAGIDAGFTLRDGTAFNVLYEGVQPVFIDFGSFDTRSEGRPWLGYKQFCEHFLAPLALASRFSQPPNLYSVSGLDGYPLSAASSMMPSKTWLNWGLLWHLHLHARSIRKSSGELDRRPQPKAVSERSLKGLLASLRNTVNALKYPIDKGDWSAYYADNSYSTRAMKHKEELIEEWFENGPSVDLVVDLGGNAGRFSAIVAKYVRNVVLVDSDHDSIELAAREFEHLGVKNIHCVVLDLTDPSTGRGWGGAERPDFYSRVKPQKAMALALIHHLVVGAGIPMDRVAAHFRDIAPSLIIEFVPPGDPMVDFLSANKSGQHHEYTQPEFERAFLKYFSLSKKQELADSGRVLYEFTVEN